MCRSLVVSLLENLALEADTVRNLMEEGQLPGSADMDRAVLQLESTIEELAAEGILRIGRK